MLHLSVFPNDEYRETVLFLVCMSIAGTFIWDRLCLLLFGARCQLTLPRFVTAHGAVSGTANHIFMAMWGEAKKTSLLDLMPIFTSLVSFAAELCCALYVQPG